MTCNYFPGFKDIAYYDVSRKREIKVAVWYPTLEKVELTTYFSCYEGHVKRNAIPVKSRFPLVIISHGSEGHRFNQHYLAEYLAKQGFIVAAVEHLFDTAFDNTHSKLEINLIDRPKDMLFIIFMLINRSEFKNYIDEKNIGIIGHSFGGFTAAVLAGAIPKQLRVVLNKKFQFYKKNIKSIVLLAPALAELFDHKRVQITIPTLMFRSENDEVLTEGGLGYLDLLTDKQYRNLKETGHYVYLMECPAPLKEVNPLICIDKGFPRKIVHHLLQKEVTQFLSHHLIKHNKGDFL